MAQRAFRTQESIDFEQDTRARVPDFLAELGCSGISEARSGNSQTIAATLPTDQQIVARVKLCWRKSSADSRGVPPYSAAQLLARIDDGDWIGSIQARVDRALSRGINHYLFLQRADERITHAALVPINALVPIWTRQRDLSARLIGKGALKRLTKNHAMNGSSPTIYLQEDRAPEIADALWNYPGVTNLLLMHPFRGGGGFGKPEKNKLVERRAVELVTDRYRQAGWQVESREAAGCGYDLECRKGAIVEHVEVKGLSGSDLTFHLTHGEARTAKTDLAFVLFIVANALSDDPRFIRHSGEEFLQCFELSCVQYRATPRAK